MKVAKNFLTCVLLLLISSNDYIAETSLADDFNLPETNDGLPGDGPIRRYDWFRNLWTKRRSQFASEVTAKQGAIVFLGDSITQGWGPNMGDSFPELNVANRGISGDTTRGMLIRLQQDVLVLKPKCVVMLMGTNDLEENASPKQIAGNVQLIIEKMKSALPEMPVILCRGVPEFRIQKTIGRGHYTCQPVTAEGCSRQSSHHSAGYVDSVCK